MPRRSHDDLSNPDHSADERKRDLTAQFWGSSPAWRTTGTVRRTRRNGDRTGPVARTRRHGDGTGQIPVVPGPAEEPLIDPYDFGFDDVGYAPQRGIAGWRIDRGRGGPPGVEVGDQPESVELIELEPRVGRSADPVSTLAQRLGLGAVDPLLLRLGVIVIIGVLLVPLAMSLRSDSGKGSLRTEVTAAPSTDLAASGEAPAVEGLVPTIVTGSGHDTAQNQSSDKAPSEPTTAPPALDATEPAATTAGAGEVSDSADGSTPNDSADNSMAADSAAGATESVQAPRPMTQTATEVAEADQPANRVAPMCQLSYDVVAGDYWIRIADAAGTTLAKLLQTNVATALTPLYPGDAICLPEGATLPVAPTSTTAGPTPTPPPAAPPTTVVPTTTAAPTTTTPVVTVPLTPDAIQEMIREVWPDDLEDRALEIAWRESSYRPSAQNWCCYGLFQIHWNAHKSWLDDNGVTSPTQLLDARTNARAAYVLYQRSGGWGPWE